MDEENISLKQKKIALATSEHAPIIIELMKDCMSTNEIIDKTEWQTIVNAVKMETQANMLRSMVDYLEYIRKGGLHEQK